MPSDCCYFVDKAAAAGAAPALYYFGSILHCSAEFTQNLGQTLRQRGYLLAIGSSSKNTQQILKQLGLGDFFDAIADGTMITKSKPDPEVFLLAASMLGVSPENAIVIEDIKKINGSLKTPSTNNLILPVQMKYG